MLVMSVVNMTCLSNRENETNRICRGQGRSCAREACAHGPMGFLRGNFSLAKVPDERAHGFWALRRRACWRQSLKRALSGKSQRRISACDFSAVTRADCLRTRLAVSADTT